MSIAKEDTVFPYRIYLVLIFIYSFFSALVAVSCLLIAGKLEGYVVLYFGLKIVLGLLIAAIAWLIDRGSVGENQALALKLVFGLPILYSLIIGAGILLPGTLVAIGILVVLVVGTQYMSSRYGDKISYRILETLRINRPGN
jgi:hypothetical protein